MFTKPIYSSQFSGEIPDRLFTNITATGALDCTFLTTMRVLFHKRLSENETVKFSLTKSEYFTLTESQNNVYKIIIVVGEVENFRFMKAYTRLDDLQIFYARKAKATFFKSENNTVIFIDKLELKHFHALQIMLPKYIPSLFAEFPLTEKETLLLKSLGNKSAVEYEKLIGEFAKDLDIRAEIIRTKLQGFETAFERAKLDEIKNEIQICESNYENLLNSMREMSAKIDEKKFTLAGLECAISSRSGDSELMEYFQCNKNLSIIKVTGTTIEFVAHGYADIYDVDAFEAFVGNHNGYFYSGLNREITKSQMEKLYRAIFGTNLLKLRICAAYSADVRTGLRAIQHYVFPPESATYLANPHIQEYGCIGTYAARFQEYMRKRDYVGGIDQAVVSARNLNFYDSAAIGVLARNLSNSTATCIEDSKGNLLTITQAINELEEGLCHDQ